MDVFSLINSNAIREYLKKIDYKFDVKQMVYLIAMCDHITLATKHDLYDELMHSYQDITDIPSLKGMSLFELLRKHIKYQNDFIVDFMDNTNAVYITYCDESFLYSTYKKGIEAVKYRKASISTDSKILKEKFRHRCDHIDRQTLDEYSHTRVYLNKYNDIVDIEDTSDVQCRDEIIYNLKFKLYDINIEFPIPFEKGDVLFDTSECFRNSPIIFQKFVNGGEKEWPHIEAYGLDAYSRNVLYDVRCNNYMNLEYYEDKLRGVYEKLKQYTKGEY